ncbi:MAG: hypothetical protein ACI8TP_004721 [Acidimicrobiales bacterium]
MAIPTGGAVHSFAPVDPLAHDRTSALSLASLDSPLGGTSGAPDTAQRREALGSYGHTKPVLTCCFIKKALVTACA